MAIKRSTVWFVVGAVLLSAILHFSSTKIPDMDSFYHLRHASILKNDLFNTEYPWLSYSVIREKAADLWYGFHLLLIPFTFGENLLLGIKLAGVFLTSILLVSYFIAVRRHNFSLPVLWPFLFLFSVPYSLFQFLMARPHMLSLALSVLLFSFLIKGIWWQVGLISVALTFFHISQFWLGVGIVLVIFGIELFQKIFIDKNLNLSWNKFAATAGGMLIGALLRPHPIAGLQLTYIQIIKLFIIKQHFPLLFGKELYPISFAILTNTSFLFLVLWGLAIASAVWAFFRFFEQVKRLSLENQLFLIGSGLLSFGFFLMSIFLARRAYSLWIIFGTLFIGGVYSFLIVKKPYRDYFSAMILIFFLLMVPYGFYKTGNIIASDAAPPYYLHDAAQWLSDNSNPGDIVFDTHWDNFATLFFWNQKNHYVGGIDPTFLYAYNTNLYWEFHFISKDEFGDSTCSDFECSSSGVKNIYSALKDDFKAKYVLVEKRRNPNFFQAMDIDSRFEKKFDNSKEMVFLVK